MKGSIYDSPFIGHVCYIDSKYIYIYVRMVKCYNLTEHLLVK